MLSLGIVPDTSIKISVYPVLLRLCLVQNIRVIIEYLKIRWRYVLGSFMRKLFKCISDTKLIINNLQCDALTISNLFPLFNMSGNVAAIIIF